ncbi:nicotinate-nucleotide adenylyltransferase [Ectothiorhodospiraceae bacterium WFHF3C12]|nr:nicotinate-nucleotide adenylyltransferase [Ectothiorhodospiraceae bacterium WFHF3C12]
MAAGMAPIGLLGGTFDPVHLGHLRPALEMLEQAGLKEVRLLPGRVPPHRPAPRAGATLRTAMVERCVAGVPGLRVDTRELQRDGPSYTLDTLISLRRELGASQPLCWIVGMDSFLSLPTWHRWRELGEHAHFLVAHRPGEEPVMSGTLADWLEGRRAPADLLRHRPAGLVHFVDTTALAISSTGIRRRLAQGRSARFLVPDTVWELIAGNGVYGYPQV